MSTLAVDGTRVAFRLHGTGGPQLSLVHGGLVASPSWERQLPVDDDPRRAAELQLITHDQRGYGETPRGGDGDTLERLAEDLVALWDKIGLTRVIAVGFSMGSMVALEAAVRVPERIAGIVLIGSGILSDASRESFLTRAATIEGGVFAEQIDDHVRRAFSPEWVASHPDDIDVYAQHARRADPDAVAQTFRGIAEWQPPDLTSLNVPALLLNGELDGLFTPTAARTLASSLRIANCQVVPGAGHTVHYERPDIVNPLLNSFAKQAWGR